MDSEHVLTEQLGFFQIAVRLPAGKQNIERMCISIDSSFKNMKERHAKARRCALLGEARVGRNGVKRRLLDVPLVDVVS